MKRLSKLVGRAAFFAIFSLQAQSNLSETDIQAFDLALRMSVRADIVSTLNQVEEETGPITESNIETKLEEITSMLIESKTSSAADKANYKILWSELKHVGYWKIMANVIRSLQNTGFNLKKEFIYNAKLKGIGFSTVYSAFKIAGAVLGIAVILKGRTDILLFLNSFSWNTTIASLLTFPAKVFRCIYLKTLSKFRRSLKKTLREQYTLYQYQLSHSTSLPTVLLDEPGVKLHFVLRFMGFGIKEAERLILELSKNMKQLEAQDSDLVKIIEAPNLSSTLRAALIWRRLRELNPDYMTNSYDKLLTRHLNIDNEVLNWTRELVRCNNAQDLRDLFKRFPTSHTDLQKGDNFLNVVLPYVARFKSELVGLFEFRKMYNEIEKITALTWGTKRDNLSLNFWDDLWSFKASRCAEGLRTAL